MRLRSILAFGFVALSLAGAGVGAELVRREVKRTLPTSGHAARGVRFEGRDIPADGDAKAFIESVASEELDRTIELRYDGDVLLATTPRELGATVDSDWVVARALAVGRKGDMYDRYVEAKAAATGGFELRLPVSFPTDPLAKRLEATKDDLDERPLPARRHIGTGKIDAHQDGRFIDVFSLAESLAKAMHEGKTSVDVEPYRLTPHATEEAVRDVDVSTVVSSFETRYGGPPGRDQNILRASSLIDGVVLMPNDELSYNALVGPRSIENGFANAPEIYKGEMREGVGGGACQVASTLHAAAFFGGLDVVERRNHSRPSGYIRPGLDATVSYPVLDLKIRNPFDFPIVVHAAADKGTLKFEILGHDHPASVELATETSGVFNYTRKIEKSSFVPEGEYRVKTKGRNGLSIKRHKTLRWKNGEVKVEESTDVFPSTQEVLIIGPKFDESTLPPLPDGAVSVGANVPGGAPGAPAADLRLAPRSTLATLVFAVARRISLPLFSIGTDRADERPTMDAMRKRLGGRIDSSAERRGADASSSAAKRGLRPGVVVETGGGATAKLGVLLSTSDASADVYLGRGIVRRTHVDLVTPHSGEIPAELKKVSESATIFGMLGEGQDVEVEPSEQPPVRGTLVEKCRYGGLVRVSEDTVLAVGFNKIWPAGRAAFVSN